jgi:hypothetical protein
MLDIPEVFRITGVGKGVKIQDQVVRISTYKSADNMRPDESGAAGDQDGALHGYQRCFEG